MQDKPIDATHADADGDLYRIDGDLAWIWDEKLHVWDVVFGGAEYARSFGLEPLFLTRGGSRGV